MTIVLQKKVLNDHNWNSQFYPFATTLSFNEMKDAVLGGTDFQDSVVIGAFDYVKDIQSRTIDDMSWFDWSNYARFVGDDLLNSDYCILPCAEIRRFKFKILAQHSEECKVFVRPNVGHKPFDGQVLDVEEFDYFSSLFDGNLAIISKPKQILGEWRFVVSEAGNVLGRSLYRYQGNFVRVDSCPPEMNGFVEGVVKRMKQKPGKLFIIDVAQLMDMSFKVIELNSIHHSGLYAMKPEPIADFISKL